MAKNWLNFAITAGLLSFATSMTARNSYATGVTSSQFHLRTGYLNSRFSGVLNGVISNISTVDIEYEILTSSRASYNFRTTLIYDVPNSKVLYSSTGVGVRNYFSNNGMGYDLSDSETHDQILSIPTWRTYLGGDLGISQMIVNSTGSSLNDSRSALIEFGPNMGCIYQISKSFGLEFQLGVMLGVGFSSNSTKSVTYRSLVGGAYYF